MEHTEKRHEDPQPRGRGGSAAAIRGALSRTGQAGLAHWGQPQAAPFPQEPVDVAGGRLPRRLPPT